MIFDDEFPVYGNVTSIDQIERIQEYVDNKILDALSWIAGKLDLIIRGHTLVIGTIIEQSGKQIKQEQRRIQRTIDKYEKTAELATFQGVLGHHVPIGDFPVPPQGPVPPIEEPFPYEPPVEPPVLPPVLPPPVNPDFPPTGNDQPTFPEVPRPDIPIGREFPPPPPPPPPPVEPDEPDLPPREEPEWHECDYGIATLSAYDRSREQGNIRNDVVVYGGQMNVCAEVNEYKRPAMGQLQSMLGTARQLFFSQGTGILDFNQNYYSSPYQFVEARAATVAVTSTAKCSITASSPYEELGEYLTRGNNINTDGTAFPITGSEIPQWLRTQYNVPQLTAESDGIEFLGNFNPMVS